MKDNRRRDMTLTIRVTEKEKLYIKKRAEKAGLSVTDYIVRLSLETPIFIPVNMQPFLLQLKRIGNNINQLTTKVNSKVFSSYNFREFIDAIEKLTERIGEIERRQ
ncbi:MAG: plasmid mobilization relaxosome protein MobC [Clostridia bacterium]|nr:plasmid mobilization relaxosome protein MobC [Clostridia bacterium]